MDQTPHLTIRIELPPPAPVHLFDDERQPPDDEPPDHSDLELLQETQDRLDYELRQRQRNAEHWYSAVIRAMRRLDDHEHDRAYAELRTLRDALTRDELAARYVLGDVCPVEVGEYQCALRPGHDGSHRTLLGQIQRQDS